MASSGNYSVTNLQVEIGDVIEIYYENYINLVSDKKDVDHKSRIAVPHGFEILKAEFVVRKQEHEVTRRINIIQPGQLSLSVTSRVIVDPLPEQLGPLALPVLEGGDGRSAL